MTLGGFEIEKKVSWGHLVTIFMLVVGLITGWSTFAAQTAENTKAILAVGVKNDQQDDALRALLATINSDRLTQQTILTEMRTDIRYLRRDVEAKKRLEDTPE